MKANKSLTMEEMQTLLIRLGKCKNPNSCPHGRPTMIFYSKYSIEKHLEELGDYEESISNCWSNSSWKINFRR